MTKLSSSWQWVSKDGNARSLGLVGAAISAVVGGVWVVYKNIQERQTSQETAIAATSRDQHDALEERFNAFIDTKPYRPKITLLHPDSPCVLRVYSSREQLKINVVNYNLHFTDDKMRFRPISGKEIPVSLDEIPTEEERNRMVVAYNSYRYLCRQQNSN